MSHVARTTAPVALTLASWFWAATGIPGLVNAADVLIAAGFSGPVADITPAEAAVDQVSLIVAGVVFVLLAVLRILLAWFLWRGQSWARIVLTLLGVVTLLAVAAMGPRADALDWAGAALVVAALALQFFPASNAYLSRRSPA